MCANDQAPYLWMAQLTDNKQFTIFDRVQVTLLCAQCLCSSTLSSFIYTSYSIMIQQYSTCKEVVTFSVHALKVQTTAI